MQNHRNCGLGILLLILSVPGWSQPYSVLSTLANPPDFQSHRISSYDRTGGNQDWIGIEPGETKVLAEIQGPGAITHLWNTINAEQYYSRMLILRIYWDGQESPSVEAPLGDFFAVGHGVDRPFQSISVDASSDGRARNCYWYMPFAKSAKITITHEGFMKVRSFYFYIDYRTYSSQQDGLLYFHAQYRQAVPNPKIDLKGKNPDGNTNYVLLDTQGKGQYVGSVVSVQMNQEGWFGEGDDMFYVDGSPQPTLIGTGTEDYFNDAWGFREFSYPYHGVTMWEGFNPGDRGTAYKWHIFDPVAFQTSLKVTLEHGHANDRQDDWYSVAFWYQTLPSHAGPLLPSVFDRLPDEGQLYAKQMFLNKEISLRIDQGQWDEAIKRIDEYINESARANDYGYWSLRKALLFKQKGDLRGAKDLLSEALEKSEVEDRRSVEREAKQIHWLAEREYPLVDKRRTARIYAACADSYELFIDGKSVAEGNGWDSLSDQEEILSPGKHVIAVQAKNTGSRAGFLMQMSHRSGFEITDSTWKVSDNVTDGWEKSTFDDSGWKNAESVGRPGQPEWLSTRQMYFFVTDFLTAQWIWIPEGTKENQTVYFRKEIQIK